MCCMLFRISAALACRTSIVSDSREVANASGVIGCAWDDMSSVAALFALEVFGGADLSGPRSVMRIGIGGCGREVSETK